MTDDQFQGWLLFVTEQLMTLRTSNTQKRDKTNAGPRYNADSITIEEEGFSRWMGWRGEAAQEQETAWPADELRQQRQERHMRAFKKLREENAEFRRFLISLRTEIDRKLGN